MWLLILLGLVVVVAVGYAFRVQILAKVLGQPESRIRRQLEQRKR